MMKVNGASCTLIIALLTASMSGVIAFAQSNSNEMIQSIHTNAVRQVIESESAVGNPYLYNGRRYEPETGLYYNRARYYNPNQGRFISRDPIGIFGDEVNLGNVYGYVGNSPLSLSDPSGLIHDSKSSNWIRVSQPWAGKSSGSGQGGNLHDFKNIFNSWQANQSDWDFLKRLSGGEQAGAASQATGRRTYEPIVFSKRINTSSPVICPTHAVGIAGIRNEMLNNKYPENMDQVDLDGFGLTTVPHVVTSAIAIPNLLDARKGANESAAISSLRTLVSAQTLFMGQSGGHRQMIRASNTQGGGYVPPLISTKILQTGTSRLHIKIMGYHKFGDITLKRGVIAALSDSLWFHLGVPDPIPAKESGEKAGTEDINIGIGEL